MANNIPLSLVSMFSLPFVHINIAFLFDSHSCTLDEGEREITVL